jgi:hypothetical protein
VKPQVSLLAYVPAAALITVGLLHFYLVQTRQLSIWRVGGYGMFSTANDVNFRYVQAF